MHRIATAFVSLLLITATALGDTEWGHHMDAAEWAFARRNMEVAEREFRAALEIAQKLPPGDLRLEESLRSLALLYEHQRRYDEAQPLFLLQLAAQEHRLGEKSPELLDTLAAVARVSVPVGDPPAAREALERYIAIADESGLEGDEQLRLVLSTLSRMNVIEERLEEALGLQRRVAEMTRSNPGLTPEERAEPLESLAQLEIRVGDPEAARPLVEEAAVLRAQADPPQPAAEAYLAAARTAYGSAEADLAAEFAQSALKAAGEDEALRQEALKLAADAAWLPVRRSTEEVVDLFAGAAPSPGLDAAERALVAYLNALPADSGGRLSGLRRLVQINALQGDVDGALAAQDQLVDFHSRIAGRTAPAVLSALQTRIAILEAAGRQDAAADDLTQLVSLQREAWGEVDARRLPTLERLEDLLNELRRKQERRAVKKEIRSLERALR